MRLTNGGLHDLGAAKILAPINEAFAEAWNLATFSNDDAGFAKATEMLRAEPDAGRPVGIDFTMPGGADHTSTVARQKGPGS